jgi:hypothetical protein
MGSFMSKYEYFLLNVAIIKPPAIVMGIDDENVFVNRDIFRAVCWVDGIEISPAISLALTESMDPMLRMVTNFDILYI